MASEVLAVQVGADGTVEIEGRVMVGDPLTWLVYDHHGGKSSWPDPEFRVTFEPIDDEARRYLEAARRK